MRNYVILLMQTQICILKPFDPCFFSSAGANAVALFTDIPFETSNASNCLWLPRHQEMPFGLGGPSRCSKIHGRRAIERIDTAILQK